MRFRKNFHIARGISSSRCDWMIERYPKQYETPKYLEFIRIMLNDGWRVKLHTVRESKYVFVFKDGLLYKIRFSNHKPLYHKQMEQDCDFYVGISHKEVNTTDEVIYQIKKEYYEYKDRSSSNGLQQAR